MIEKYIKYGLRFPKLVELGINTKKVMRYKLDWYDFNNESNERYNTWLGITKKGEQMKREYVAPLNDYYMKLMTEQEFLIPTYYMEHIRHYANLGNKEWIKNKPFDTSVRDTLLEVSEISIQKAFYLISDCIHGVNSSKYDACKVKIWLSCALANFWMPQTGRGLVRGRAKIEELENYILKNEIYEWKQEEINKFDEWIKAFDLQYELINKMY